MKKFLKYLLLIITLIFIFHACDIMESDSTVEVIEVKNFISYHVENYNTWECKEAVIYINKKLDRKLFPI